MREYDFVPLLSRIVNLLDVETKKKRTRREVNQKRQVSHGTDFFNLILMYKITSLGLAWVLKGTKIPNNRND